MLAETTEPHLTPTGWISSTHSRPHAPPAREGVGASDPHQGASGGLVSGSQAPLSPLLRLARAPGSPKPRSTRRSWPTRSSVHAATTRTSGTGHRRAASWRWWRLRPTGRAAVLQPTAGPWRNTRQAMAERPDNATSRVIGLTAVHSRRQASPGAAASSSAGAATLVRREQSARDSKGQQGDKEADDDQQQRKGCRGGRRDDEELEAVDSRVHYRRCPDRRSAGLDR